MALRALASWVRFVGLAACLAAPGALLLWLVLGRAAALGFAAAFALAAVALLFMAERISLARLRPRPVPEPDIEASVSPGSGRGPKVLSLPAPVPAAFVCRAPFSRGTLLLSQGLLATLDDRELGAALRVAATQLRDPALPLRSLASTILGWLESRSLLHPRWGADARPWRLLVSLAVHPWARLVETIGSPRPPDADAAPGRDLDDALRKMSLSGLTPHWKTSSGLPAVLFEQRPELVSEGSGR